jgi:hypothetical protein
LATVALILLSEDVATFGTTHGTTDVDCLAVYNLSHDKQYAQDHTSSQNFEPCHHAEGTKTATFAVGTHCVVESLDSGLGSLKGVEYDEADVAALGLITVLAHHHDV